MNEAISIHRCSLPWLAALWLAGAGLLGAATGAGAAAPWEVWSDLRSIAEIPPGDQVLLRSSHCPDGCRFDRHSDGDSRFLYVNGEEGIVFDEAGAGAITRIWMTMGPGGPEGSEPLNPDVSIRFYLDGAEAPVIDLPLPTLFDGSTPPFVPPLVGNRLISSGGNVSYVPIPYRSDCRVALVGAEAERIWFQFTFHRLADPGGTVTFTGEEDLSAWIALLTTSADDPWPASSAPPSPAANTITQNFELAPRETAEVATLVGADLLTAVRVLTEAVAWPSVEILLHFDGNERVRMPLADFFAVGRGGLTPTQSLLLGVDAGGVLYSYFPKPFFEEARIELTHLGAPGSDPISLEVEYRTDGSSPSPSSGLFGAVLNSYDPTTPGIDSELLSLGGHGKWVGLFTELGSVGTSSRQYLEGDERAYIDGSPHPAVYGTGVEDFFNGGFYFDQGPFVLPLHGSPYHLGPAEAAGEDITAAYRLMIVDGVNFDSSLTVGLEGGPTGQLEMRARTVAYSYLRSAPRLTVADALDLGDADSRTAHAHEVDTVFQSSNVDSFFEGEPPLAWQAITVERPPGTEGFVLDPVPGHTLFRLRRRFDSSFPGQEAEIWVNGAVAGSFPVTFPNPDRRWQEMEVPLAAEVVPDGLGSLAFEVVALPVPGDPVPASTYTASLYELRSGRPSCASLPLARTRLVSMERRFSLRARLEDPGGDFGGLDPRDGFAAVLTASPAAVHARVPRDDPGWSRSRPEKGRFKWEGERGGVRRARVIDRSATKGFWKIVVKGRYVPGAAELGAANGATELQLEISTSCTRSPF